MNEAIFSQLSDWDSTEMSETPTPAPAVIGFKSNAARSFKAAFIDSASGSAALTAEAGLSPSYDCLQARDACCNGPKASTRAVHFRRPNKEDQDCKTLTASLVCTQPVCAGAQGKTKELDTAISR